MKATAFRLTLPSRALTAIFALLLASATSPAAPIVIDTVPVGNPGNIADTAVMNDSTTGYGTVAYSYRISQNEVTIGQYIAFLTAVAQTDKNGLYHPAMATDAANAGILRIGSSGSYTYSPMGSPDHPITYVSWGSAARFANWLYNNQPTGAQGTGTTETGSYTLNGATTAVALNAVLRNSNATWVIPTENEWYKAAYYQPNPQGGDADDYWAYPMRTNNVPFSDQPPGATPDNTRVGNFLLNDGLANNYNDGYAVTGSTGFDNGQNYLTDVGAYGSSPSFYDTFDQGGNVWEWNESLIGSFRGIRGGRWDNAPAQLASTHRGVSNSTFEEFVGVGFRLALVPEPSAAVLAILAGGVGLLRRPCARLKRERKHRDWHSLL